MRFLPSFPLLSSPGMAFLALLLVFQNELVFVRSIFSSCEQRRCVVLRLLFSNAFSFIFFSFSCVEIKIFLLFLVFQNKLAFREINVFFFFSY